MCAALMAARRGRQIPGIEVTTGRAADVDVGTLSNLGPQEQQCCLRAEPSLQPRLALFILNDNLKACATF